MKNRDPTRIIDRENRYVFKGGIFVRTLDFIVEGQRIRKDPNCDFSHIVAGSMGYLQARFTFSDEWKNCVKVASFWREDTENAAALDDNNTCMIPAASLVGDKFKVSVIGARNMFRINTGKTKVRQEVRD